MKEKSTIYKSDVLEMFDRTKMSRFDMLDFANRNKAEITIKVKPNGESIMQIVEQTNNKIYFYELLQNDTTIKYQEVESKK